MSISSFKSSLCFPSFSTKQLCAPRNDLLTQLAIHQLSFVWYFSQLEGNLPTMATFPFRLTKTSSFSQYFTNTPHICNCLLYRHSRNSLVGSCTGSPTMPGACVPLLITPQNSCDSSTHPFHSQNGSIQTLLIALFPSQRASTKQTHEARECSFHFCAALTVPFSCPHHLCCPLQSIIEPINALHPPSSYPLSLFMSS